MRPLMPPKMNADLLSNKISTLESSKLVIESSAMKLHRTTGLLSPIIPLRFVCLKDEVHNYFNLSN